MSSKLVSVNKLIISQRSTHKIQISDFKYEVKSLFHPSEYKLIIGLVKGLENSLSLEYLVLISENKKEFPVFDIWALHTIADIYRKSV